ncbi:MAG: hypothetical protein NTW30_06250 [Candidatus Aenigmarchaeota archaeon]|nr:hypothetical protein [Candidatus Aenigmarchaeota archaeon]
MRRPLTKSQRIAVILKNKSQGGSQGGSRGGSSNLQQRTAFADNLPELSDNDWIKLKKAKDYSEEKHEEFLLNKDAETGRLRDPKQQSLNRHINKVRYI